MCNTKLETAIKENEKLFVQVTQNRHPSTFRLQYMCPIQLFKLYKKKTHPEFNYLWQCPKQGQLHWLHEKWYDRVQVGCEPLEGFMGILSGEASLSKRYTNRSIRSTVMGILGHKYEG